MTATSNPHNAPGTGRRTDLHALATQIYALISSGDDRLAFSVGPGGPMLVERRPEGMRLLELVYPDSPAAWYRAKELRDGVKYDRRFNPWVLTKHLQGRYSVAPSANGWVSWACIDIDAHQRPRESELDARRRAKRVLGDVWRALSLSATRHPPLFRSPGGGYHLYLPLTRGPSSANAEHTWPARVVRAWLEWHLTQAGLELGLGDIEVYPSARSLRAPCGRGMVLLQATQPATASALGLMPWPGTATAHVDWHGESDELTSWVRVVEPTARAFIAQFESQRRSLAEWLGRPEATWDPRWAFLGWREADPHIPRWGEIFAHEKNSGDPAEGQDTRSQESDDVPAAPLGRVPGGREPGGVVAADRRRPTERRKARSANRNSIPPAAEAVDAAAVPAGDKLVRGRAFMEKVGRLLREGVTEPGARYDAVLTLTFYWGATCGLSTEETLGRLEAWCAAFAHAGSRLAPRPRAFLDACVREARHYLEHRGPGWPFRARGGHGGGLGTLRPEDQAVIAAVDARVAREVATMLAWLAGRADSSGCVAEPVQVSHGLLARLCGDRRIDIDGDGTRHRAATVALTELERIGVLTLARQYVVGKRGRVWSCWYRFGSGVLPRAVPLPAAKWSELTPYSTPQLVPTPAQLEVVRSAPSAPLVDVLVLGECPAPEGQGMLRALSAGVRGLARTLFSAAPGIERPTATPAARAPWFERHYQLRPMTPGRLWAANSNAVLAERRGLSRSERLALGGGALGVGVSSGSSAIARSAPSAGGTVVPLVIPAAPRGAARAASSRAHMRPSSVEGADTNTSQPTAPPSSPATTGDAHEAPAVEPPAESQPRAASSALAATLLLEPDEVSTGVPDGGAGLELGAAVAPSSPRAVDVSALRAELAELTDPAFAASCDADMLESLCAALRAFRERGRGS